MATTKQLKVYKGLPTIIKSRARGYYDNKTVLTFNTDAESQNITMDVYDGLSYDIVSSVSGVKVLNFVNTVLPYKWDYSTILSTNRYCFAPVNGGSDVPIYTYNFNIIGSPTINNTTKIVGDFSGSDYLTIDGNPNFQDANSWEFVTKVTVGSTSTHQKIINGYGINLGVTNSGYLHLWLYNGSWFIDSDVCSASLLSTNPFIKLSFDGTTYSCYISADGETWTLKYSYNSTIKITPNIYTLNLGNSSSEYWRGTIDLSETSITINGDAWWIPEFTSHTEKFYYVDCYKYNNFTKVGSPVVNEDTGLVSNFSTSNYLQLPQTFNPRTSDFEIVIAGIPEENSSYVIAGTQNSTMALSLQKSCFLSTGGSTYNISLPITSTYSSGQKTWLKIVRQGNTFTRYSSLDGTTWVTESSATDSSSLNSVTLNIGFYGYETSKSYIGTVDLSETYINVNGSRFWEAKSEYSYNNFSVIGSLNIDYTTSTVSGFSTSNYIQLRDAFNPENNPWEVQVKFTTSSDVTTNQQILHSRMGTGNSGRFGIGLSFENTHFNFFCSSNGSSWLFDLYGTYTILTNTTYWLKIGWDGVEYYLEYSLDGETYTRDITNASTSGVYSPLTSSFIGVVNTGSFTNAFGGSIDLSETNIKVNNSVWWEGVSPNRELMPGILSNYTDDGSAVTLNCFANGDTSVVLTPDNNYNGTYLGTVNIQAHTAYNYDPDTGEWTPNV